MTDKAKYWVELSDYDLMTAEAMMKSSRFLYVGFMCHQTVEKIFKAYYVKLKNDNAPFSHSLSYIARKGDFYNEFAEEQKKFIDQLEPLNIETRYPLDKEKLLESLNQDKCREILNKTRELQEWIKLKL
jgi:HEPN domain-containing protein